MPELRLTDACLTFVLDTDAYVDPAIALSFMQRLAQEDRTISELRLERRPTGDYTLTTTRTSGRNWSAVFTPRLSIEDSRLRSTQDGDWTIAQTRYALRFIERILIPAILALGIARLAYTGQDDAPMPPAPPVRE